MKQKPLNTYQLETKQLQACLILSTLMCQTQDHRITQVQKYLWKSSSSNSCSVQAQTQQADSLLKSRLFMVSAHGRSRTLGLKFKLSLVSILSSSVLRLHWLCLNIYICNLWNLCKIVVSDDKDIFMLLSLLLRLYFLKLFLFFS